MSLKIGTRKSKLAQVQTDIVIDALKSKYNLICEKVLIETLGDKILDKTLDKIGGKGLFVKEIERAMLEERADAAVHSMKDVPYELPEGFEIVAILNREDVRDAFISLEGVHFSELRKGAKIGTSSIRRAAQLKLLRDDIEIVPIRGNVQTRISKMEKEKLDGIILAVAGLKRLNLENIITDYFDVSSMVPAVGQGALGIEILSNSKTADFFKSMDDSDARICVEAERSFMKSLNGDCHSSIGAYATLDGNELYMIGMFGEGNKMVKKDIRGPKENFKELGEMLGKSILR